METKEDLIYNDSINNKEMESHEEDNDPVPVSEPEPEPKTRQELIKQGRRDRLAKAREKLREMQSTKNLNFKKDESKARRKYPENLNLKKIEDLTPEEKTIDNDKRLREQLKRDKEKDSIRQKQRELKELNLLKKQEEEHQRELDEYHEKIKKKPIYYSSSDEEEEEPLKKKKSKKNKPVKKISIKYYHEPTQQELNHDQIMIQREQEVDFEKIKYKEEQQRLHTEEEKKLKIQSDKISEFDRLKKMMMSGED